MKSTGWCVISRRGRRLYVFIFAQWKHSKARSSFISVHRGGGFLQSAIRRPNTSSATAAPATHDTDPMESPSSCASFNYSLTLAPFTLVFIHGLVIQEQVENSQIYTTIYKCTHPPIHSFFHSSNFFSSSLTIFHPSTHHIHTYIYT